MKKEVQGLALGNCAVARKRKRIDAVERLIVTTPDQRLEFRDDPRAPGPRLLHFRHLAFEKTIIDAGHDGPLIPSGKATQSSRCDYILRFSQRRSSGIDGPGVGRANRRDDGEG